MAGTIRRNQSQGIGNFLVQVFVCAISPVNLMEHFSVLDKQHAARMAGRLRRMRHHQDRLAFRVNFIE